MENIEQQRTGFEAIGNTYPVAENVAQQEVTIAGVHCAWFIPPGAVQQEIIFFIHGGGFIFGSIQSHAPMVSHFANALKRKVLAIDYRLAPEHPFPAGLNDCTAVIKEFTQQNTTVRFGIIGDSAGGNLVMTTQLKLKMENDVAAQYSIIISPWADLECKNPSYTRNKSVEQVLSQEYLMMAAKLYAGNTDLTIPLLSPVNADFKGWSPILIVCGTHEILEDDSIYLHKQLLKSGVDATLKLFTEQQHVWPFMDIDTAASREAITEIARFANRHSARIK